MEFLTSDKIIEAIRAELGGAKNISLAIAFWGEGAVNRLGIDNLIQGATIICDAYSGACNPNVLQELLNRGHDVWTLDHLHAKVVLTDTCVIVGSSNASANGLGAEGAEARNIEAAILCRELDLINAVDVWFAQQHAKSRKLLPEDIKKIIPLWKARRRSRKIRSSTNNLLTALCEDGFKDKPIRAIL